MYAYGNESISIQNLCFSYEKDSILQNIDLDVVHGSFLAVIGPNGGGKTTFLRLLLGLLEPSKGNISLFGLPPQKARTLVGYVPQYSTLNTIFPSRVLDMVLMGAATPSLFGGKWAKDKKAVKKAKEFLSMMDVEDKTYSSIDELSGGQRQRALIARALMGRSEDERQPFLLLLDEPTSNIDPAGKHCLYESLGKLRGKITIIVVSHEMFIGSDFFDNVVFINKTITNLPEKRLTGEAVARLFGDHHHDCPLGDLQHASGVFHEQGCSHEACIKSRK